MVVSYKVSQKVKHRITIWTHNSTPTYILERTEDIFSNINLHIKAHRSTILNNLKVKLPKCSSTEDWMNRMNLVLIHTYDSMDEAWKQCAKWKNAGPKRSQIIWFHIYEIPESGNSIETEGRLVVARGWNKGEWGVTT